MSVLDMGVRVIAAQKREAMETYMGFLHADPEADPTEEEVDRFITAVRLLQLSGDQIRADESGVFEKRRLEALIAEQEKAVNDAQARIVAAEKAIKNLEDEKHRSGERMGADYRTPASSIQAARATIAGAQKNIEGLEKRLRQLRIDCPIAWKIAPPVKV